MSKIATRARFSIGAATLLAVALSIGPIRAEHGGEGMGHRQHDGDDAGMGHDGGHGGKAGGGHGGKHGGHPGMVEQVCHDGGSMPPHYCAPSFKVMSSVPGLQIVDVGTANDRTLWVKLSDLNAQGTPFPRNVVIVGGGGGLAGATLVAGGWQQQTTVQLALDGNDTVYGARGMHLHAFPVTGP